MMPEFGTEDDLLDRLATRPQDVVWMVGAAITTPSGINEPGVPDADGIVERVRAIYTDPLARERFEAVLASASNPHQRYRAAFRHLTATRGLNAANEVIRRCVLQARRNRTEVWEQKGLTTAFCRHLENDLTGWHLPAAADALGQIINLTIDQERPTVLTSNFDPLIQISIRKHHGTAFVSALHSDGGLAQLDGDGCLVVHLHGDWCRSDTLHTSAQIGQVRPKLSESIAHLVSSRTLVVLGHTGSEDDIFTTSLARVIDGDLASFNIIWAFPENANDARVVYANLLALLEPGIRRGRVVLYESIHAHKFLPQLARTLSKDQESRNLPAPSDHNPATSKQLDVGTILGEYRIIDSLGGGGYGSVWKANGPEGVVALKILHSHWGTQKRVRERFFRGAERIMAVRHPLIVRILQPRRESRGYHYYVMQFIEGLSLADAVVSHSVSRTDVFPIILRLAEALAAAHETGYIHRDVKPANIIINQDGVPFLADFDFVTLAEAAVHTYTGPAASQAYTAPEVLRGEPASPASDVYSLAATTIFCLCAKNIISHDVSENFIRKLHCSSDVADVLVKAISDEPTMRFLTMSDFHHALEIAIRASRSRKARTPIRTSESYRAATEATGAMEATGGTILQLRTADADDQVTEQPNHSDVLIREALQAVLVEGKSPPFRAEESSASIRAKNDVPILIDQDVGNANSASALNDPPASHLDSTKALSPSAVRELVLSNWDHPVTGIVTSPEQVGQGLDPGNVAGTTSAAPQTAPSAAKPRAVAPTAPLLSSKATASRTNLMPKMSIKVRSRTLLAFLVASIVAASTGAGLYIYYQAERVQSPSTDALGAIEMLSDGPTIQPIERTTAPSASNSYPPTASTHQSSIEWWCLCYRRDTDDGSEPVTNCGKSRDECEGLKQLAENGSSEKKIVRGSLTHDCRAIIADLPGDVLGGRGSWAPSLKPGAWLSNRNCWLDRPGGFQLGRDSLLDTESIGGISLGQLDAHVVSRMGEPSHRGSIEITPATGESNQDWEYPTQSLRVRMNVRGLFRDTTVSSVTISQGSSLTTAKGIGIGSSRSDVLAYYGSVQADDSSSDSVTRFVAGSVYGGIFFEFDSSGEVKSIFMGAGAE